MDQTVLVGPDVATGKRIVDLLERNGFPITSAFWIFFESVSSWKLVIASPLVDAGDPRAAYWPLARQLRDVPGDGPLRDITLVNGNDPLVRSVASRFRVTGNDPSFWASGIALNDRVIDGAYIYRSTDTPSQISCKGFTIEIATEHNASLHAGVAWIHVDETQTKVFRVKIVAPDRLFRRWEISHKLIKDVSRTEAAVQGVAFARRLIDGNAFVRGETHCRLLILDEESGEFTLSECPTA